MIVFFYCSSYLEHFNDYSHKTVTLRRGQFHLYPYHYLPLFPITYFYCPLETLSASGLSRIARFSELIFPHRRGATTYLSPSSIGVVTGGGNCSWKLKYRCRGRRAKKFTSTSLSRGKEIFTFQHFVESRCGQWNGKVELLQEEALELLPRPNPRKPFRQWPPCRRVKRRMLLFESLDVSPCVQKFHPLYYESFVIPTQFILLSSNVVLQTFI